ncbi:hypothetical protein EV426DRAFT_707266 [Tirmania nivea]|nr:hypothetical protein EV426DRAFT_707266 [Tirmania nivea]
MPHKSTTNSLSQATNPHDSCTGTVLSARPFRSIASRASLISSSFPGESLEDTRITVRPDMKLPTHNNAHDTQTSTSTQPLAASAQSHGTQNEHGPSLLPRRARGAGKRLNEISQSAHAVDSGDGVPSNKKRVCAARNRTGGECWNGETRKPSSIRSMSRVAGVMPQAAIGPPTPRNRTFITNTSLPLNNTLPTTSNCAPSPLIRASPANIPSSAAVLGEDENTITYKNSICPTDSDSLYPDLRSLPFIDSPLPLYRSLLTTTPSVQLQYDTTGHIPEHLSFSNSAHFPAHVQPIICTRQGPHLDSISAPVIPHTISLTSKPTTEAQQLQEDVSPKDVYPLQLLAKAQVHQIHNSPFPPPTVQAQCPRVLDDNPLHLQQNSFGDESCPHCSQLWFTHCECIFATSLVTRDCKEKGPHQLHASFQELKNHIQEHWIESGASCCLCQNLFSDHLLDLQLLPKVNSEDPRHWQIRMDLRQGVFAFRKHVREKHELRRGEDMRCKT